MKNLYTIAISLAAMILSTANVVAADIEYVDLGLPSGTLWANMNVGATSEEETGIYVGWGETAADVEGRTNYGWATYKWCDGTQSIMTKYVCVAKYAPDGVVDNLTVLEAADDAATTVNGTSPTLADLTEIINRDYCTWTLETINDRKGARITSVTNGNSIFIPAGGFKTASRTSTDNSAGCIWSCELYTGAERYYYNANVLRFGISSSSISTESRDHNGTGYVPRNYGYNIRPVQHPTSGIDTTVADSNAIVTKIYNANGVELSQPATGLNIIVYSDGTTRKVVK